MVVTINTNFSRPRKIRQRLTRCLILVAGIFFTVCSAATAGELYPRGDVFCFTFYSTSDADSLYALTNGATAIGPFYAGQTDKLRLAEQLNTKILYKVDPPCMVGKRVGQLGKANFQWPADSTVSNEVAAIVNAVKDNPCVAMWDIAPEELRAWVPEQLHYLKLVAAVIRANDPWHRPIYMYDCNNRGDNSMVTVPAGFDLCAKGSYVNDIEKGAFIHNRIWLRWSMEEELAAAARSSRPVIPWVFLWMAHDPAAADFHLIPTWCRHDVYLGLIMGGKGISVWSAARHRDGFSQPAFDAYFDGYLSVARDLNGPLQLAPVFLFGKKISGVTTTVTDGPKNLRLIYQKTTNSYPAITSLATAYNGTNYLFMVNSAEEAVTATFSGLPAAGREDLFAGGIAPTPGGKFSITLPPLGVKAFRFTGEKTPLQTARIAAPRPQ
jgi:hypothetical protein